MSEFWEGFAAGFAVCASALAYLTWRMLDHEQPEE